MAGDHDALDSGVVEYRQQVRDVRSTAIRAGKGTPAPAAEVRGQQAEAAAAVDEPGRGPEGHVRGRDAVDGENHGVALPRWRTCLGDTELTTPNIDAASAERITQGARFGHVDAFLEDVHPPA
jgi:hypothetical protein